MARYKISKVLAFCAILAAWPAHSAVVERLSAEQLLAQADGLVLARLVEKGPSYWRGGRIFTRFTFLVERGLGVSAGQQRLVLEQPGGQVGRWRQLVSGYPDYRPGRRLLLFLESGPHGLVPLGLSQGVFAEVDTPAGKRWQQCLRQVATVEGRLEPLRLQRWSWQELADRWQRLRARQP